VTEANKNHVLFGVGGASKKNGRFNSLGRMDLRKCLENRGKISGDFA
jgi:hypothetical protein